MSALREKDRNTGQGIVENQIKVGDIVLIHEDNQPRVKWRMGRVTDLHYGNDNLVRSVALRTSTGYTNRPIRKLYHLESADSVPTTEETKLNVVPQSDNVRPLRKAAQAARSKIAAML